MHLIENNYEKTALLQLAPHARDVAEQILTVTPLNELLQLWLSKEPDTTLLTLHKVPIGMWSEIVDAALLAKVTYFLPNERFDKEEVLYLIKIACLSINKPLSAFTIKEVIELTKEDYPVFSHWLTDFAFLLKQKM